MRITLVGLNGRYTHSCMALFYLRNEIVEHIDNTQLKIFQLTINDPYYQILMHLSANKGDYYFFSAAIWNSDLVVKIVADLLLVLPETHVVVGGPQAEIVGAAINHRRCSIVVGEIEGITEDFYLHLQNRTLRARYKCQRAGKDFTFPYVESDFSQHLENRHIYYESSRGCPFSCTYCLSSSQKGVFHKDLAQVKSELCHILEHNPKVVRFVDRTFNDNEARALAIWRFLAEHQSETLFHFEISPSNFNEEMFDFLQNVPVGRFQFEIGIQSTNPETLRAIRRPMDVNAAHDIIIRLSKLANIHLHVDLILGLPYETKESFLRSFRDVFAMNPNYIQMGLLKILPDTPICHTAPEYMYHFSSSAPYSVFASRWMEAKIIQELYWFGECVERFLNNRYFTSLWIYLRDNSVDIVLFFLDVVSACLSNDFFQKAPTQQLLCSLLIQATRGREDEAYIIELLRYDWLRCGHRFLPPELDVKEEQQSKALKNRIYEWLKTNGQALKHDAEIVIHLKRGFVVQFSSDFVQQQGYRTGRAEQHFLCFLPERDTGLYHYNKEICLSLPS